jgi:hypothetical protein
LGIITTDTTQSVGSATDLWNNTVLVPADVNTSTFGIALQITNGTWNVDAVQLTVYYSSGINLSAPAGGGSITLINGRKYTAIFKNSAIPHYSDLFAFSASTGPLTAQNQPLTAIPVSTDPQVDRVILLATADGGDQTVLYFLTDLANGTTTYTDNTPETTLVLQNTYLSTDDTGVEFGVANNQPPPSNLQFPIRHRGRFFGLAGSKLFFSKAEFELFTSTGFLAGKWEESWPPLNNFDVAVGAETGRGLLSDGQSLFIGTEKRIIRLIGDSLNNFLIPDTLFNDVGILNHDVWQPVFMEGVPVGVMWLTPDYRVVRSDFNTYLDVGHPIQNILDNINQSVAQQVSWARYVGISVYNMYILAVPTGTSTQPDTLLVFDLKNHKWYVWKTTDKLLGGFYNITNAGVPQFIVVAASGNIFIFDQTTQNAQDNGINFTVLIRTSWLGLSDASARKYLNEIEVSTGDPTLTVTVEGSSTVPGFSTPHVVANNVSLTTKPLGELAAFLAGYSTKDRYYRFTFTSTGTATDILRNYSIEGNFIHRV